MTSLRRHSPYCQFLLRRPDIPPKVEIYVYPSFEEEYACTCDVFNDFHLGAGPGTLDDNANKPSSPSITRIGVDGTAYEDKALKASASFPRGPKALNVSGAHWLGLSRARNILPMGRRASPLPTNMHKETSSFTMAESRKNFPTPQSRARVIQCPKCH
ncbi:hypothetical protein CYLTODRAFT_447846, partial [Cylindrobasidium torrendii FP15055 ss-10]